jgi:hypothetical protein
LYIFSVLLRGVWRGLVNFDYYWYSSDMAKKKYNTRARRRAKQQGYGTTGASRLFTPNHPKA